MSDTSVLIDELAADEPSPVHVDHSDPRSAQRRITQFLAEYGLVLVGAAIFIVGVVTVPSFAGEGNLVTIMRSASCIGVAALGMTFVVLSGNYADLSIAAQVGIAAVCSIALQPHGMAVALGAALAACLLVGVINGLIVGVTGANAVVVTLGTGTLSLGVLNEATDGAVYAGSVPVFADTMSTRIGPIPLLFVYLLAVAVICYVVLSRSTYGAKIRAIGSNPRAARVAGVRNSSVIITAFVACSACCALSGIMLAGFSNSANPHIASSYVFEALAAIIIGGNALKGGNGGAGRTLLGVLIIAVVANLLVLGGFSYEWKQFVTGIIIVAAVGVSAGLIRIGLK